MDDSLPNVWVVRADGGQLTASCVKGGFTGIGWNDLGDLSGISEHEVLMQLFQERCPDEHASAAGNIARFRLEIREGDYVITPAIHSKWLYYGRVTDNQVYFRPNPDDGCRYAHRRRVEWAKQPFNRLELSIPLQSTLRAALTVFKVRQEREFIQKIGELKEEVNIPEPSRDFREVVLRRILELTPKEFEELVGYMLAALGFDDTQVVGGPGDQGVDVKGTLNNSGVVRVDVYVQVKRYSLTSMVSHTDVLKLRQKIPAGGQGAVITTARFQKKAHDYATEQGFPRIGLIDGPQLVDILVEHWSDIPEDFRDKLGMRPGLVPA